MEKLEKANLKINRGDELLVNIAKINEQPFKIVVFI